MRVIAGKARHLKLKTMEGMNTRPTTDRIKETLFNMISFEVEGSRFLDLFGGSGAIGIEALSRGASKSYFVENHGKALSCIKDNLRTTGLACDAVVIGSDVMKAIENLDRQKESFDIIFMDPPYGRLLEKKVLLRLDQSSLCGENTLIIVESDLDTTYDYLDDTRFIITKIKRYKTNKHTFIRCKQA